MIALNMLVMAFGCVCSCLGYLVLVSLVATNWILYYMILHCLIIWDYICTGITLVWHFILIYHDVSTWNIFAYLHPCVNVFMHLLLYVAYHAINI